MKRITALMMVPLMVFGMATACTPQKAETAKSVFSKITFYSSLARTLITVAETKYPDNQKVKTALVATRASLKTLESTLATLSAGVDKDESALSVALVRLISDVFDLMAAINQAKSVKMVQ